MKTPLLRVFLYPDVSPLERSIFDPILQSLHKTAEIEVVEVNDHHAGCAGKQGEKNIWIIAKHWRKALHFLGANRFKRGSVFLSALDLDSPREGIHRVLAKKVFGPLPKHCTLLVHSPINFRFFGEMEKLNSEQLRYLPLPVPMPKPRQIQRPDEPFTVGTLTSFTTEGQLGFLATVAHYVLTLDSNIRFRILGSGPLHSHAIQLGEELELGNRFIVSECLSPEGIEELDAFLYCPLRNDHFIPLLMSAGHKIPTVASEMSGIDDFLQDGKTGFVVPVNETKSMGELVLRLATHTPLREQMGLKFNEFVTQRFSLSTLFSSYFETLTNQPLSRGAVERAA